MASSSSQFTISARADTDVWKKPPAHNVFNAPHSDATPHPLRQFESARLTVTLPPAAQLLQYDQGGLLLELKRYGPTSAAEKSSSKDVVEQKWLKTGIEFYNSVPYLSTVGCDRWADWSIVPLKEAQATIYVEREKEAGSSGGKGKTLWVYLEDEQGVRTPLRELCWLFVGEEDTAEQDGGEWFISVSAYACRPAKEAQGELQVTFNDLDVVFSEK